MRAYVLLSILMLACAGCGYRGPLYLPQSKPEAKAPPAPTPPAPPERPTPSEALPAPK
ncbi:MAG: LPS translocon maturation chaperone LptM [Rhodospirillaceae bacterium]